MVSGSHESLLKLGYMGMVAEIGRASCKESVCRYVYN